MGRSKAGLNHECYVTPLEKATSKYYRSHRRWGGMCQPARDSHAASVKAVQRRTREKQQAEVAAKSKYKATQLESSGLTVVNGQVVYLYKEVPDEA